MRTPLGFCVCDCGAGNAFLPVGFGICHTHSFKLRRRATANAAGALANTAKHTEGVGAVVAGGGVAALIKVLQEGPAGAKTDAARHCGGGSCRRVL